MKLLYILFAGSSAAILASHLKPKEQPIAHTHQREIHGVRILEGVDAFLGIPYAKPPIGQLRFEPPQPLDNQSQYTDPLQASHFGPVCHQFHYKTVLGDLLLETSGQSEDCLTLNIFVPRLPLGWKESRQLPVYIWSFGGAFAEGGGSVPIFDPTHFVAENKDIIVVTWNYRLNIFGFPNSPALSSQNLGLRDQRAALEWLRDNVASFGGDPNKIISGGQSAGADSSSAMAYSHAHDPIFAGLVLQSGTVQIIGAAEENVDAEFVRVARIVGCADAEDRVRELECMRLLDAVKLQHAVSNNTFNLFGSPAGGTPMVDNVTLFSPSEYMRRGRSGNFAKVPTLMGSMNNESDSTLNWSEQCGVNKTLAQLGTKAIFTCNIALEAKFRQAHDVPVWRYRYMGMFPDVTPYPWLGAYHQADIPLLMGSYGVFPHGDFSRVDDINQASRYLQGVFASFIRDPERGLVSEYGWPTYQPGRETTIELFPANGVSAHLRSSVPYDKDCASLPDFPWQDILQGPPKCQEEP